MELIKINKIANIFCDASIDLNNHIGCSGSIIVNEDLKIPIEGYYSRQYNATNNSSEINAILNGVLLALKYYRLGQFEAFRIFSDSKICIYGLREWSINWVRNQNDGLLIKSDGEPVLNQECIKNIIRLIIDNNLPVQFLHQKGHCKYSRNDLEKARAFFVNANGFSPESIGLDTRYICAYNNEVDITSRQCIVQNHNIYCDKIQVIYNNPLFTYVNMSDMTKFNYLMEW